ncbi:MAG: type II secretion system protein [Phycisphaerae bacterium]|nr:type II secretion system protein [Phycisphaerae bacterium]
MMPTGRTLSPHARAGFSLLEVLVAAVILGGALVVILGSISGSLLAEGRAARLEGAYTVADDALNRAAAGAVGALPADRRRDLGGVTYQWRVERVTGADGEMLRCVVTWRQRNRRRRITLQRLAPPQDEGVGP